jgi:phosphoserine phosphatase RsbU/P
MADRAAPASHASIKRLSPAALLVLSPNGQRTRHILDASPYLVGRQTDSHLVLRDNRVSRQQAQFVSENGHWVLEDLNSRHGTWVNGQRIARHVLRNSDRIDFGVSDCYQLTYVAEKGDLHHILDQFASTSRSGDQPAGELAKLRSLVEVARALQNSLSTKEVLTAVVDAALSVTGCERGFLLLRKNGDLEVTVARDNHRKPLEASELRVPTTLIRRALASRRDLLSMDFDPFEEQGVRPEMTVAALELRSVVCLPLIHIRSKSSEETGVASALESTVGLIYMDSRQAPADLSAGNRELLQTLAVEASTILENARLIEEERDKLRIDDELRIARDIQRSLQPPALPSEGWLRAAGSSTPSTQVGGDYFDVHSISEDTWAVVVADVSGKGVSSALLASLLQGTFLMASGDVAHMAPRMSRLNEFLLERAKGEKYATVFYCVVDASGLMNYTNAGHCSPLVVSPDGKLRSLPPNSLPVGMLEGSQFEVQQVQLLPGDKVVVYSDGLTEAQDAEGGFYGTERIRLVLKDCGSMTAGATHAALIRDLDRFTEGGSIPDDITALVIEYAPSPKPAS